MFTITNLDQDHINALIKNLTDHGCTVTVDLSGVYSITGHGVKSKAAYSNGTLTVNILSKPFYVSLAAIENGIRKALGLYLNS